MRKIYRALCVAEETEQKLKVSKETFCVQKLVAKFNILM